MTKDKGRGAEDQSARALKDTDTMISAAQPSEEYNEPAQYSKQEWATLLRLARHCVFQPFDFADSPLAMRKMVSTSNTYLKKAKTQYEKFSGYASTKGKALKAQLFGVGTAAQDTAQTDQKQRIRADILQKYSPAWSTANTALDSLKPQNRLKPENSERLLRWQELSESSWEKGSKWSKQAYDAALTAIVEYSSKGVSSLTENFDDQEFFIRINRALERNERNQINSYQQLAALDAHWHQCLIDQLYPRSASSFNHKAILENSFNVSLGVIVATNLPFTGMLVGLINSVKIVIKACGRLSLLMRIHGYPPPSGSVGSNALYATTAEIVRSLNDWQNNPQHVPLSFSCIDALFSPESPEEAVVPAAAQATQGTQGFEQAMKETLLKEAYIAVPLAGMVSLGKIIIDDALLDQSILSLVQDYLAQKHLAADYGSAAVDRTLAELTPIFSQLKDEGFLDQARKNSPQKFWKNNASQNRQFELITSLDEEAAARYQALRHCWADKGGTENL